MGLKMKKITLIFLALAVVINSFSVANVQSEAAENDIENEVHTEILIQIRFRIILT